jgi:ribosomal protein S18 acetylase RimI-like enzyme
MPDWAIRVATQNDAASLSACFEAAYAHYVGRIADLPNVSDGCAEDIAQHQAWVAEIENTIVGGLVMIPGDGFIQMANVAVHPGHKGAGLGRQLIDLAQSLAIEQGYSEIRLATHVEMPENVRLYEYFGWEEYHRSGNKVLMKKTIKKPEDSS